MLKVYYNENSPNCFKVKTFLLETGLDHESIHLDFSEIRNHDFSKKFPSGAVPAIEDGDTFIGESCAILLFLAEKHGTLIPKASSSKALMYQALAFESSFVLPTVGGAGIFGELGKPEEEQDQSFIDRLMPKAQKIGVVLERMLVNRDYLASEFSIADLQMYAAVSKAVRHGVIQNPPKAVIEWIERVAQRDSVLEASKLFVPYRN